MSVDPGVTRSSDVVEAPAEQCAASVARRVGRGGLLAATVGALPLVGPWLASSLVACCGLGVGVAATGVAASAGAGASRSVGFGAWWLMVPLLLLLVGVQSVRARRRHAWVGRIAVSAAVTLLFSAAVYAGAVVAFGQLHQHRPAVSTGPTLP